MIINIIGKGKKEKGETFEDIIKISLTGAGFTDFRKDVQTIGMEFDLKATHKTTNEKILCECKAHTNPIGTPHLTYFHSKLRTQLDKKNITKGLFFRYLVILAPL